MAHDLRRVGYRRRDVFGIYGFNLLLLPSISSGRCSWWSGHRRPKIAFARTPKIRNRTVAPLLFLVVPLLLIGWSGRTLANDISHRNYIHGTFAGINLLATAYACIFFVGLRNTAVDLFINVRDFIYRPVSAPEAVPQVPHWASVLYVGSSVAEEVRDQRSARRRVGRTGPFWCAAHAIDRGRVLRVESALD